MERRSDIRAAMQRLLTPEPKRSSEDDGEERALRTAAVPRPYTPPTWIGTPIEEIQITLREYGVWAESREIADALLIALTARPELCYGLFASYLLGGDG
ncbi:MAG: hypothetical protein ACP5VE_08185 [Chthonomonadales bacterium]